jgi:hypothetical protein
MIAQKITQTYMNHVLKLVQLTRYLPLCNIIMYLERAFIILTQVLLKPQLGYADFETAAEFY